MSIDNYYTLFYVLLCVSGFFFLLSFILFFRLHIGRAFLELTGIAKTREMQEFEIQSVQKDATGVIKPAPSITLKSPTVQSVSPVPAPPVVNTLTSEEQVVTDTDVLNLSETSFKDEEIPDNVHYTGDLDISLESPPDKEETCSPEITDTFVLNLDEIVEPEAPDNHTSFFDLAPDNTGTTVLENGTTVLTLDEEDDAFISSLEVI